MPLSHSWAGRCHCTSAGYPGSHWPPGTGQAHSSSQRRGRAPRLTACRTFQDPIPRHGARAPSGGQCPGRATAASVPWARTVLLTVRVDMYVSSSSETTCGDSKGSRALTSTSGASSTFPIISALRHQPGERPTARNRQKILG